jgi:putative endonuclease
MEIYYVYILKSEVVNRYYIGCTTDDAKRLKEHNLGKTKSTKPYRPWKLIYKELYTNKQEAYKREWHLKHPKGYLEKIKIIAEHGEVA